MATMTDSYHPESLEFTKHQSFGHKHGSDLNEVVKSKPTALYGGMNSSYRPFVNNNDNSPSSASCARESHDDERQDRSSTGIVGDSRGYKNYVTSSSSSMTSSSSSSFRTKSNVVTSSPHKSKSGADAGHFVPLNSSLPVVNTVPLNAKAATSVSNLSSSTKKTGYESLTNNDLMKLDLGTMEGGDGEDDETEALLDIEKSSHRPASIYLGPGDIGLGGMTDTLTMGHKKCVVTLEDDIITWKFVSRKETKTESLYLSDIYAVVQGSHSQAAPTPLTPHSPAYRPHPLTSTTTTTATPTTTSSSSSSSSAVASSSSVSHPQNQAANPKKLQRNVSSLSFSSSSGCYFTLHALKSHPGTVGNLIKVTFRCQTPETAEMWVEQITHQMQNFGNRPRKLYIVINPVSGASTSANSKTWQKIQKMFQAANIHTDILTTQHRFHAREQIQTLELSQYDGIVAVGGDGLFNEVLNGLLIQTQNQSGVNLRRSRFIPVTPSIRLGVIPTGFNNTICRSIFSCKSPMVAAAQILLGCSSPVDVCSVSQNNTLLLFSAGPMSYGFWSDTALSSRDFSWMGSRRFDCATLRTLLSHQHFEAEIQFVPIEDPEEIVSKKEKCYNRCQKCSNFDNSLDSPSGASEKGASVMAAYNEIDRDDKSKWKTITGQFSSVVSCLHTCCSVQAPHGISPYGHVGNGCTDLIMLTRCSTLDHAKWIFKQRKKSSTQFDHPYVHIRRVKEFRFREILRPVSIVHRGGREGGSASSTRSSVDPDDIDVNSVDNLVVPDDDEITNSKAGARSQGGRKTSGNSSTVSAMATSQWNIDGDELPRANVEVRVHRHLVSVFGRGIEPLDSTLSSSNSGITVDNPTDLIT